MIIRLGGSQPRSAAWISRSSAPVETLSRSSRPQRRYQYRAFPTSPSIRCTTAWIQAATSSAIVAARPVEGADAPARSPAYSRGCDREAGA